MSHGGRIPELVVRLLHGCSELSNSERYHIITYCNQNADSTGKPGLPEEPIIDRGWRNVDDEEHRQRQQDEGAGQTTCEKWSRCELPMRHRESEATDSD